MSVITILIAAAVAAGISYALHLLDKNNQTMEKVKRFTDKRMGDFEAYFKEREKNLTAAKSQLEASQMQAVAAVSRLENQIAEFQKMTKNLSGDSTAVRSIEEKIKAYDTVINEL